jgi:hypothetical protein
MILGLEATFHASTTWSINTFLAMAIFFYAHNIVVQAF